MFGSSLDSDVILARIITLIVAVTVHEFAHAWSAYQLGDPTAARLGRITLNPVAHFDPIGFLGMMMIAIGWPAFGWGKPVPVNPNLVRGHKSGMAITAAAGPISNVIMATLVVIPIRFGGIEPTGYGAVLVEQFIFVNLLLAAFNMIPIPPLDGSKILAGFLPNFWYPYIARMEQFAFAGLLVLILVNRQFAGSGRDIIGTMYFPVFDFLRSTIVGTTLF
jgi:Zn-dependent protease